MRARFVSYVPLQGGVLADLRPTPDPGRNRSRCRRHDDLATLGLARKPRRAMAGAPAPGPLRRLLFKQSSVLTWSSAAHLTLAASRQSSVGDTCLPTEALPPGPFG